MKTNIFGAGFILGKYAETYPEEVEIIPRNTIVAPAPGNILYGISTVHNYHPTEGNPYIDIETNLLHFIKVLDNNINSEIVFNLISTWFVYGETEVPAKETSPCNPKGFYSITARAREQLLISLCETFHLKYRIMRLGNIIGIGDKKISKKKNALQFMVRELAQGRQVDLYKNGAVRDYMDVRDCVQAIHLILEKGELNQIYNVANGTGYNVRDLVEAAWQESEYRGKINDVEVPEFHKTVQCSRILLDVRKLKSLGYIQQYNVNQSVRELVHHYQREQLDENGQNPQPS